MSQPSLRCELLLLACCARYRLEPRHQAEIERLAAGPLDWQRVLAEAEFHGIQQLLHHHLGRSGIGPEQVRQQLRRTAQQTLARNMELTAELARLTRFFQDQGLRFLWFKGPVVAELCAADLHLRNYSDLDLLIDFQTFPRCCELLRQHGYSPQFPLSDQWLERQFRECAELAFFHASRPRAIDVHWQLMPEIHSFALRTRDVWSGVRHIAVQGMSIPTLGARDTLLYACLHAAKHDWSQLKWLVDIAEMARAGTEFPWSEAWSHWAKHHNPYLVGTGLRLAADVLDAPIPPEVLQAVPHDKRFERVYRAALAELDQAHSRGPKRPVWPWLAPFYLGMTAPRDRRRQLYHILLRPTPQEWQFWPLSQRWSSLYYLLRPARLAARAVARQLSRWRRTVL
jgi:hypothetical protein